MSRVIYHIFMALKQTSKIMGEVTYSWNRYIKIVEGLLVRIIQKKKAEKHPGGKEEDRMNETHGLSSRSDRDIEIDVDSNFFTAEVVPTIHQTMMSNVKIESTALFNLVLSLKLALAYGSINPDEYHFILSQLISLK